MHEEIQEKRRQVEAHQRQACPQVIRQKEDEAREQLKRMDEYVAASLQTQTMRLSSATYHLC
jgi:hypothetical protein